LEEKGQDARPPLSKRKKKVKGSNSAPLTRQGYRSGRLADDFWTTLNVSETPQAPRKKLRVYPFLTKNQDKYLVENNTHKTITSVHIAELLAGVPWTTLRAGQHIVNEVAQALHKILIFNNQQTSPFQTWQQGNWFSQWELSSIGEHICTLYVSVEVQESQLKIRRGKKLGWKEIPTAIQPVLQLTNKEEIQATGEQVHTLREMAGSRDEAPPSTKFFDAETSSPFSVLNDESPHSTQNPAHGR
jgi:hypothetical protein